MAILQTDAPAAVAEMSSAPASFARRERLVVGLVVTVVAGWSIALDNGIFIDESLYVRGGASVLDQWLYGAQFDRAAVEDFSGAPWLYPVLAAVLDHLGGLTLVRLLSTICVVLTMLTIRSLVTAVTNPRAGMLAAAMFGFTGPVLYVGFLGTFDALVILMLATAGWLGVTKRSWASASGMGAVLALAVATKYAAFVFVAPVVITAVLASGHRQLMRAATALVTAVLLLTAAYHFSGADVRDALMFTTLSRTALAPVDRAVMIGWLLPYVGPLCGWALLGLVISVFRLRSWRSSLLILLLLGTAAVLPAGQLKLGEAISFHKHLAYSALFLAPVAGWAMWRVWRYSYSLLVVPVILFLTCVYMVGMFRSHDLVQYPDVRPVVAELEISRGAYLSSSADSLAYFTKEEPGVQWEATFRLYPKGPRAIRAAVASGTYEAVVIHAGPTGSASNDEGQRVLLDALEASNYVLERVGEDQQWLIYSRRT